MQTCTAPCFIAPEHIASGIGHSAPPVACPLHLVESVRETGLIEGIEIACRLQRHFFTVFANSDQTIARDRPLLLQPRIHGVSEDRPVLGVAGELEAVRTDQCEDDCRRESTPACGHQFTSMPHGAALVEMDREKRVLTGFQLCAPEIQPTARALDRLQPPA